MKRFLVVALSLALVFAISMSAMAAIGTWKSYASDGSGSLTTGSQSAYYTTKVGGVWLPETVVSANWTAVSSNSGDAAVGKGVDYSTTSDGSWSINDNNSIRTNPDGNTYQKTYVTPGSLDASRGIVMAKIKVNTPYNTGINTAFGVSLGDKGVQLGLRGSAWRIRDGEGSGIDGLSDPANVDQSVYRCYAISWLGSTANVWYSTTSDWSGNAADWVNAATFTMASGSGTNMWTGTADAKINGIVLYSGSSSGQLNMNVDWVAQTSLESFDPTINDWRVTPYGFDPTVVPEPGSIVAMCSGLIGMVGFARRRRA